MSLDMGQVTAPTSPTTIHVCDIPPGGYAVLSSNETAADVYLGTKSTVTSATGFPMVANSYVRFEVPITSDPVSIYATSGTGTQEVGYLIVRQR